MSDDGFDSDDDNVTSSQMDLLFVLDVTGSMQPYIDQARDEILQMAIDVKLDGGFDDDDDLRFGLIVFRDHPPQDTSLLTQTYGFFTDIDTLRGHLASLTATGGGDIPEAQADALERALFAGWRSDVSKTAVLVTDSPPHGVSPGVNDGFPTGCPLLIDPLQIADRMAGQGIILNIMPCEPNFSSYTGAYDFYQGLIDRTDGDFLAMADPAPMRAAVTGLAFKALDTDRYAARYKRSITHHAFTRKRPTADIVARLHGHLSAKGAHHHDVSVPVYVPHEGGARDARVWATARSLKEAKAKVSQPAGSRLKSAYAHGGVYPVTSGKVPITRDHVHRIVSKVVKQAPETKAATHSNANKLLRQHHK